MSKRFAHCGNCRKKRWGRREVTPDTENTVTISFTCSRCEQVTTATEVAKKVKRKSKKKKVVHNYDRDFFPDHSF